MKKFSSEKTRAILRTAYHRLPLPQDFKWRLRERLGPILKVFLEGGGQRSIWKEMCAVFFASRSSGSQLSGEDPSIEWALASILKEMSAHAMVHGPLRHWLALPFLSTGGAERVALNFCRAVREHRPQESVVLFVADRRMINETILLPSGVLLVAFDDHLQGSDVLRRKSALLRYLLISVQPHCFHNINSEVAWNLIVSEGDRLQRYTRLFASIFAFQFADDESTKIGYAAYYLEKAMPYLTGLLSDNRRFLADAAAEYGFSPTEQGRTHVLYQPCRVLPENACSNLVASSRGKADLLTQDATTPKRRPQVLWAGRLDAEKRVDLFLEIVRKCTFVDFRVFGHAVLDDEHALPPLANLTYEGPFSSPLEWLEKYDFDAFVFTSRWEGMPNTLIEVGALGIPIIAPVVGGVAELVSAETGYPLAEKPTAEDYESALRQIVSKPEQAKHRANCMRNLVFQRHGWSSFRAAVEKVPDYLSPEPCQVPASKLPSANRGLEVSVIIPCYNQGRYLQESVASVLAACTEPLEIIIVDDGSTDPKTSSYLSEVQNLCPTLLRVHRQENQGLSGARNAGINLARGEYIQFLDADDLLVPGKIDAQIAQMRVNSDLDVSICNFLLCDESRSAFPKMEEAIACFDLSEQDFLYRWERGFVIPIHCGLFRRSALESRPFDIHARAKEDWLFWTMLALGGVRFGYIHGHWAIYRQHDQSMRRSYVNMGRAWLQAGLKIEAVVGEREPLFFESVVSWFDQCYRAHPSYRAEIARERTAVTASQTTMVVDSMPAHNPAIEVQQVAEQIIRALAPLATHTEAPLISVIVPVYGHFEYIQGCLESLGRQGDISLEVICLDDNSPDVRVSLLMDALKGRNSRLVVRRERENRGISATQNLAVELAHGEYVAFLDCDDSLVPGALQEVGSALRDNPAVDYLFTDRLDVNEKGKLIRLARYGGYENIHFKSQEQISDDLLGGMVASHLKVIRRSVYLSLGGCSELYSGVQDWELALRMSEASKFYYLDKPLYRHRIHTQSVTHSDSVAQFRKTNVVRRMYLERSRSPSSLDPAVTIFKAQDFPVSLNMLKVIWKSGGRCVADLRGAVNLGQINFLREYNAYFDQVLWDDPRVPAALFGYLCCGVKLKRDIK